MADEEDAMVEKQAGLDSKQLSHIKIMIWLEQTFGDMRHYMFSRQAHSKSKL